MASSNMLSYFVFLSVLFNVVSSKFQILAHQIGNKGFHNQISLRSINQNEDLNMNVENEEASKVRVRNMIDSILSTHEMMLHHKVSVQVMSMTYTPSSDSPSDLPSDLTSSITHMPSMRPSSKPKDSLPTPATTLIELTHGPSEIRNTTITIDPTDSTSLPAAAPPSMSPTLDECPGITEVQRSEQILEKLDTIAQPNNIRNGTVPQGLATNWIIKDDKLQICPDNPNLIQRWTLAVMYYSTKGDDWFQCAASAKVGTSSFNVTNDCGSSEPFINKERFLSPVTECAWAGISCIDGRVSEIEFEQNNLAGTIPTEIGLLKELAVLGMERGNLTSTIPTEIGLLTNLIFLDLDFNELTGTLSPELLSLSSLTQLDLNNNKFSGSINEIDRYPFMEFLQLHSNDFTGTVPEGVGMFVNMAAFTLHETLISGTMPQSVCDLLLSRDRGGVLGSLMADCSRPNPNISCDCCTDCRTP